jgi:hypothetical protein
MSETGPSLKEAISAIEAGERYWGISPIEDANERLKAVAEFITENQSRLDMGHWLGPGDEADAPDADFTKIAHTCGTTACIAGWAILLAGDDGKALLRAIDGQYADEAEAAAGFILLGHKASDHFYDEDDEALEFLQGVLEEG